MTPRSAPRPHSTHPTPATRRRLRHRAWTAEAQADRDPARPGMRDSAACRDTLERLDPEIFGAGPRRRRGPS